MAATEAVKTEKERVLCALVVSISTGLHIAIA
jgi:hypothetical protein